MLTILRIIICIQITSYMTSFTNAISGWVEPARPNEFSFIVSIARTFDLPPNNPYGHTCGGALIGRRYVLTSANCFLPNKNASDYFVYLGPGDLAQSRKIGIDGWITYECWLRNTKVCIGHQFSDNDIAIVTLSEKVYSPPLPVKISMISPADLEGKNVITAGWGLLFNDTIPQNMLKADLRVISNAECLQNVQIASNDPNYKHENNIFCTNGITLFAVLDGGDRGSPVLIEPVKGDYRIVGVNQKATPSVNDIVQIPEQQNKHIRVYHYVKFLRHFAGLKYLYNQSSNA